MGPDLRLATLVGDGTTVARVEGRQALGTGWVSYLLQETVAELWEARATGLLMARASAAYAGRRRHLVDTLATHGIAATGSSGLTMWVPVADELGASTALLERGWAVAPGERFRIRSAPAIRIGIATLTAPEARDLAAAVADALGATAAAERLTSPRALGRRVPMAPGPPARPRRAMDDGHQFQRPHRTAADGTSSVRTTNVSSRMPIASPVPIWRTWPEVARPAPRRCPPAPGRPT